MNTSIKFENMEKHFPDFTLGPLNFEIEQGRFVGYIGSNGAGKTTTMHCITGLLKHDAGKIRIMGEENDPNKIDWKLKVGYVGDRQVFYENWTAAKNLKFISQFYPDWDNKKVEELVKRFDLQLDKPVSKLSKGNRMKLSLVQVLSRNPKVLILDEPTDGLDPLVRSEFIELLFEIIQDEEKSIFYSTHVISEIERVCDELVFISKGKIIEQNDKETLIGNWRVITLKSGTKLNHLPNVVSSREENGIYKIVTSDYAKTMDVLKGKNISDINSVRMNLEDIAVNILKGAGNVEVN